MTHVLTLSFLLVTAMLVPPQSRADEAPLELKIKNHRWEPELFEVRAGERFKIRITNEDPTSEEFESRSLIIEKFIGPNRTITVTLGPLKPGEYDFFGCFHPQTAKGKIIAK